MMIMILIPRDYLYDFSCTDITNMFYKVYLDGFTNEDGSVNWLHSAASVEGYLPIQQF